MPAEDALRQALLVPVAPLRAFALFCDLDRWWPREYTWSAEVLEEVALEPRLDGRATERGPHGFTLDWGRLVAFEPPRRLVLLWQIGPDRVPVPDPARASEVEVRFAPEGDATRVELEHRAFARHGEAGAGYRDALASPQGWPYMLDRYVAALTPAGPP
jgi:uncharacterized protein YndB with AHSA1/START domain